MDLLVSDEVKYRTVRLDGFHGERFPTLVPELSHPDLLSAIVAPASVPTAAR